MAESQLIASHLSPPDLGSSPVLRTQLVARLSKGATGNVTLVTGEPAAGKTSLLVQWIKSEQPTPRHVAWVTVPAETDDEIRFWMYLLAALSELDVGVDDLRAALLDQELPSSAWLTSLANRLVAQETHRVIVIDDLHELQSTRAVAALGDLLDMKPTGVSFVIATRVVPPWPLATWRMAGRLTEIQSRDLGITLDEARELAASADILIGDDEIGRLLDRTERWFGGVQLAVLAMQREADPAGFVARFAADDELVSTYLLRDVVKRQDPKIGRFLLEVSVLDDISSDLCDEVRGATNSAELLEQCRSANLFLSRAGVDGMTYRLHALFRELLRARLEMDEPDRFAVLHLRASRACEQRGDVEQAIGHAIASGDTGRTNEFVLAHAPDLGHQARFDELRRWATVLRRPGTTKSWADLIALASVLCFSGEATETLRLLDEVETLVLPDESRRMCEQLRGAAHMVHGDVHLLKEIGRRQRRDVPPPASDHRSPAAGAAMFMEGVGTFFEGDLDGAAELFERADRAENRPAPPAYIAVKSWASLVALRQGDLSGAERCVRASLDRREQLSSGDTAAVATALLALAELSWEQNRLDDCGRLFTRARKSVQPMPWQAVLVECSRSRLTVSLGEPRQALNDLSETGKLYLSSRGSPLLSALVAERAVDVCLRIGDDDAALGWAHTHQRCGAGDLPWATRIRMSQTLEQAQQQNLVREALGERESTPHRIDTFLAAAGVAAAIQDRQRSRVHVAEALSLAEPGRVIRRFVDAEPHVAMEVGELAADPRLADGVAFSRFFAAEVVDACEAMAGRPAGIAPIIDELVVQLSGREVEVLRLLADGLSYTQMGDELFVSRNTIKSHVQHVYTKLGVSSREQAADAGTRFGLI
jgi:LuxR family maltose regulon positive regulatory protein